MTAIITPLQTRSQDPLVRSRSTARLLAVMTAVQLALGVALLITPAWMAHLLAGVEHTTPETAVVLRVAGGFALAIGCWCALGRLSESGLPRSRPLDLVPGLVVYNGCAVAVMGDAILRGLRAPLLWPTLMLHTTLLVWCVTCLARERAARR